MAALSGRKIIINKGDPGVKVAAARSKSITINNEPIDITSDDDQGVRQLLEGVGEQAERSMDLSIEGVTKDATFLADITTGANVDDYEIEIPGIGTFTGKFFLTSAALTAPYNDATTFTAELQSTGPFTFTPEVVAPDVPEQPPSFPSEDTPYYALLSVFAFALYQQGDTVLAVEDAISGSHGGLGLPYAHAAPPGSSVNMVWVPGMPETMVEANPSENTRVSYECNAYGEQTDLSDAEIAFLTRGDISSVARSHARFRKITYNPASDECIEIVDVGDFAIRDLPSFDAWIGDAISGEVMNFRLYPSFAIGQEVGGPACFEAMGRIICRAYPL